MLYFDRFYQELHNLLQVKENAPKGVNQPPALPVSRHRSPGMESTVSNSTDATGVSGESIKEHYTQGCARAFLLATLQALDRPLTAGAWFSDQYEFSSTYVPLTQTAAEC